MYIGILQTAHSWANAVLSCLFQSRGVHVRLHIPCVGSWHLSSIRAHLIFFCFCPLITAPLNVWGFEIHLKWRTVSHRQVAFEILKLTCFRSKVMCGWGLPERILIPVFFITKSRKTGQISVTKSWISRERHVLESKFKKHEYYLHISGHFLGARPMSLAHKISYWRTNIPTFGPLGAPGALRFTFRWALMQFLHWLKCKVFVI